VLPASLYSILCNVYLTVYSIRANLHPSPDARLIASSCVSMSRTPIQPLIDYLEAVALLV
jgi:hypothetical protein